MTPAEVVPMWKKKGKRDKNKYRSASVLSNASKVNGSSMQEQISGDSVKLLSEFEWRFPQGFNAQKCLLVLIKNHLFLFELIFRRGNELSLGQFPLISSVYTMVFYRGQS